METYSLKNPPIREAIFDIRFQIEDGFSLKDLSAFNSLVKDVFPKQEIRVNLSSQFNFEGKTVPDTLKLDRSDDGFILRSHDGEKVIQIRLDGFTFSVIQSYTSWDNFFDQALHLWHQYREIAKPVTVQRLALRFINSISIPLETEKDHRVEDYLHIYPEIGEDLKLLINNSFLRMAVSSRKFSPSQGIITEFIQPEVKGDNYFLEVLLDLDVYQLVNMSPDCDEDINNVFCKNLRLFKNELFFGTLTPKTVEIINA